MVSNLCFFWLFFFVPGCGTCLRWLRTPEHLPPSAVQEGGAVAVVEGAEVLGDGMRACRRRVESGGAELQLPAVVWPEVLTERHHQEAHVVEPVGGFIGQLGDEELQDGPEVALAPHRCHLHRPGHGRVTVTAGNTAGTRETSSTTLSQGRTEATHFHQTSRGDQNGIQSLLRT